MFEAMLVAPKPKRLTKTAQVEQLKASEAALIKRMGELTATIDAQAGTIRSVQRQRDDLERDTQNVKQSYEPQISALQDRIRFQNEEMRDVQIHRQRYESRIDELTKYVVDLKEAFQAYMEVSTLRDP